MQILATDLNKTNDRDAPDDELGNPCWMTTISSLVELKPDLAEFYENESYSELEIYVAGKVAPDPVALALANEKVSNLRKYLELIDKEIGFNNDDGWWFPSELCVPLQNGWIIEVPYPQYTPQEGIKPKWLFYIQLWSEYGSGPSFIFFEDDGGKVFTGQITNAYERIIKKEGLRQLVVSELKQQSS